MEYEIKVVWRLKYRVKLAHVAERKRQISQSYPCKVSLEGIVDGAAVVELVDNEKQTRDNDKKRVINIAKIWTFRSSYLEVEISKCVQKTILSKIRYVFKKYFWSR